MDIRQHERKLARPLTQQRQCLFAIRSFEYLVRCNSGKPQTLTYHLPNDRGIINNQDTQQLPFRHFCGLAIIRRQGLRQPLERGTHDFFYGFGSKIEPFERTLVNTAREFA